MNKKIALHWETPNTNLPGNALGYNQHNSCMKKYSEQYFDYREDAEVALHIRPADLFVPVRGKINVLFTMWENLQIPNSYIQRISRADALIVPSSFCRDIFRNYYDGKIYVCHEGIESAQFPFYERTLRPGDSFRVLWVGAANPRKGYPVMVELIRVCEKIKGIEIYIKTTTQEGDRRTYVNNLWKQRKYLRAECPDQFKEMLTRTKNPNVSGLFQKYGKFKNIIFDSRKLSFDDLRSLYNSAHIFCLPTFGEGWGLTLCEAMATGCPSIATPVTGCTEYFDDYVGYEIDYRIDRQELLNYEIKSECFVPSAEDTLRKILYVVNNYQEALRKGKRASNRIHSKFTWDHAAKRLYEIMEDVINEHKESKMVGGAC